MSPAPFHAGETPHQALVRELAEELNFTPIERDIRFLGTFSCPAANEPGHLLEVHLFHIRADQRVHGCCGAGGIDLDRDRRGPSVETRSIHARSRAPRGADNLRLTAVFHSRHFGHCLE